MWTPWRWSPPGCTGYRSLYELLDARGFTVLLVNARHVKNVSGGKSDVLACLVRGRSIGRCAGLDIGTKRRRRESARYEIADDRVAQFFNPIDNRMWYPDRHVSTRAALGLPLTAPLVMWHGRVVDVRTKGIDVLLDGWHRFRETPVGTNAWLLMVGSGRDSAWLQEQGTATAAQQVLWINEYILDRGRMRSLLSAADVYAFPSRHEGFPVGPLEAMACGLPVVSSDVQGIRDILTDRAACGIVVPREDPAALAAGLASLLSDEPKRATMSANALRRIETTFSLAIVGRQLRDFLLKNVPPASGAGGLP